MERNTSTHEPVSIVFCYAHEDEYLLKQLQNHLQLLQRTGLITLWYDRDIQAGSEWKAEISKQLDAARVILLLISTDFLASDYPYSGSFSEEIRPMSLRKPIAFLEAAKKLILSNGLESLSNRNDQSRNMSAPFLIVRVRPPGGPIQVNCGLSALWPNDPDR